MSFFRTHRARAQRSKVCGSSDPSVCRTFRRLGDMVFQAVVLPSAPIITSSSVLGTTLTIDFTPGDDAGNPITNYQYSIDNGVSFIPCNPAVIVSPVTITGLTLGSTYLVILRPINSVSIGLTSIPLSIYVPTSPSAPTNLTYTVSGTIATVSFDEGDDGGSAITNYEYSIDNGSNYSACSPAIIASPVTIIGLTPGSTYSIKLRAVNSIGSGDSSSSLSIVVPTIPSAPTGLSYTTTGTSAIISFTAGSNGGREITNYKYSIDNGANYNAFSPAVIVSPITITGLTNGTTYSVLIRAVNSIGDGTSSSVLSVAMPAVVPSAPSALSSSNIGTKSFTLSFTAGATGGSAITNYQYSIDGGANFTAFSPADIASPVTISDLSANTTYSIKLKAVNIVGAGASSAALSVTTAKIPGSLQFNGTTNYLTLNPGVSMGAAAYTIECWFYNNTAWNTSNTSPVNYASLLGHTSSATSGQDVAGALAIFFADGFTVGTDRNGGDSRPTYTFANSITLNAWHHFVLVRNSSQIETVFIDGIKAISCGGGDASTQVGGQQTHSKNFSGHSVEIGNFYQGYWPGYLANFRMVVGTAVYDPTASSITLPTAALTNISGTEYLMVGDTVTDDGSSTQTVTNINNVLLSEIMVPL